MNRESLRRDHPEVHSAILEEGRRATLEELNSDDSNFVSRELYDEKTKELEDLRSKVEGVEAELGEAKTTLEESQAKVTELEEANTALEEEKAQHAAELEEEKAKAERAAAEAFVAEALASHPHREALRKRLSDEEMSCVESATAALEREQQYLDDLNIPAAPINTEGMKGKGKAPNEDNDEAQTEEVDAARRRLNRLTGMSLDR